VVPGGAPGPLLAIADDGAAPGDGGGGDRFSVGYDVLPQRGGEVLGWYIRFGWWVVVELRGFDDLLNLRKIYTE